MDPLRIGIVQFLNTVPLVEGLDKVAELKMIPAPPSQLSDMLESDAADVALVSVIDAATSRKPLALLSCGMIGCDGPTLTVRVFSSQPFDQITVLHADTDSHTSIALARVILARMYGRKVEVVPFDAAHADAGNWPPALLLIGDKVITRHPPASHYPYQLDLGEAWKKLTGLPFVYALWMCRESDLESPHRGDRIRLASALIDRQRRHNTTRLARIIQDKAPEFGWPAEAAHRYLGDLLRYEVGETERSSVRRFLSECAELGLVQADRAAPVWAE